MECTGKKYRRLHYRGVSMAVPMREERMLSAMLAFFKLMRAQHNKIAERKASREGELNMSKALELLSYREVP